MGVKALPRIAVAAGRGRAPADEPVAVVERGHAAGAEDRGVDAGRDRVGAGHPRAGDHARRRPVAALREQIAWLESRPLYGRTVAVTRARAQASRAGRAAARARRRGRRGARDPHAAARRSSCPDVRAYDLLCVTSPTGADQLFTHLRDARDLAGVTVAAIGPGTARALRAHGVEADIVPERAVAEGLVEALDAARGRARGASPPRRRARRPPPPTAAAPPAPAVPLRARPRRPRGRGPRRPDRRAARARRARRRRRALRDRAPSRSTTPRARRPRRRLRALHVGVLGALLRRRGRLADGPRLVSIGPATSAELREHGAEPDLEADPHTPDGLVAALLADAVTSPA